MLLALSYTHSFHLKQLLDSLNLYMQYLYLFQICLYRSSIVAITLYGRNQTSFHQSENQNLTLANQMFFLTPEQTCESFLPLHHLLYRLTNPVLIPLRLQTDFRHLVQLVLWDLQPSHLLSWHHYHRS